jgi:alcohol dehydrogenase (cytochrome c)
VGQGLGIRALAALAAIIAALALAACGDDNNNADTGNHGSHELGQLPRTEWKTNGGTLFNDRYSPLTEINTSNVANLKGEWMTDLKSGDDAKYSGEAQPLVVGDHIYVITGADDVFALDIATGKKNWTYKANLDQKIKTVCCGWTSRGVGYGDGKVYVGQLDGKLVALDAQTGKKQWETQVERWQDGYTITSAPLFYNNMVVTGVSGGEFGIRGHVDAYDANTGKRKWRFYTIPGPGEFGHDTWPADNDTWKRGGGPVWQTPAVDPERNTIYFSTGNTAPDFDGSSRGGDNLFANAIVAVDADTGKRKWHYQLVHHDIWDYDAPAPIVLFDHKDKDGKNRAGLAATAKTGWVYLLDRGTGKPLVGIDEKKVLQEPRNKTAPTQPHPRGDAFVDQQLNEPVKGFPNPKNKGKIFTPFWTKPIVGRPGTLGGSNWPPTSYNPKTGLLYVCGTNLTSVFKASKVEYDPQAVRRGESYLGSAFTSPKDAKPSGTFTAIDPKDNTIRWQNKWSDSCYSGSTTTAGNLVFTGRNNGDLTALDARNGKQLWGFQTGAGANATPTIFERNGTQYVAFYAAGNTLAGTSHGDNFWLFSLKGKMSQSGGNKTEDIANGGKSAKNSFETNCSACHGPNGEGGHLGPKLQELSLTEQQLIKQIENGSGAMPAFKGKLTDQEIKDLAKFVRQLESK